MDDLIEKITSKFGVDASQAKGIIETVAEFVGDKLPGPIGSQVKKLLGGNDDGDGGDLMGQVKGLFGG